jgi:hypothetical protein
MLPPETLTQWLITHKWAVFFTVLGFFIFVRTLSLLKKRRNKGMLTLRTRKEQEKFSPLSTIYNPRPYRRTNRQRK